MRAPLPCLLVLLASVVGAGCGQIADTETDPPTSAPHGSGSSTPTVPGDPSPPTSSVPPTAPAAACGVAALTRSFATADLQAVALHGLWVGCTGDRPPALCPDSDAAMYFGTVGNPSDVSSRVAACGHLSTHGDSFIRNAAYVFTYEVTTAGPSASPTSSVRVWNDTADRTFALTYRDERTPMDDVTDATITLLEPDGKPGSLRRSAFTTF